MRRTVLLLAGVLLSIVALGSDSPKEYDDATVDDGIEGAWQLVSVDYKGQHTDVPQVHISTYRRGSFVWNGGCKGRYTTNTALIPHHLDEVQTPATIKDLRSNSIYEVRGNTLRVAHSLVGGTTRPKQFADEEVIVYTYKRVK